jgi:beta-lactamase regulating signal transducer with metallopeptidase domain
MSEPFTVPLASAPPPAKPRRPVANPLPAILTTVWALGFVGIGGSWWVRWRRITTVVRAASRVPLELPIPAVATPAAVEPGVFGVVRPLLLLPENIFERLSPEQLNAVIAHELYHVRHHDNLVAALHMFVETVFWFHPMVWWIGRRMVEERERACDEGVLSMGSEPRVYAEAVLNVCKLYVESSLDCVSGITGANLKRRIEVIMTKRIAHDLNFAKKLGLAIAALAALLGPFSSA